LITVLLLLTVFSGVGCVNDRQVISQAASAHEGLAPAVMTDPELAGYVQEVGDRIIRTAYELDKEGALSDSNKGEDDQWMYSNQMKFHFVNSETLNAFTTGGEHMYLYTELFRQCKSEDELAAVMAHEFAHIYARHVKKGMNRQYGLFALAGGAAVLGGAVGASQGGIQEALQYGSIAGGAALIGGQFLGMGFTRKDENEADKLGFYFYTRAGWDPRQFAGFFQTMIDKGFDTTPELASDHPTLASRVESTAKRIEELPPSAPGWRRPPVADAAKFRQLQDRSKQLANTVASDKSMEAAKLALAAFPSCVAPVDQPSQTKAKEEIVEGVKADKKRKK